MTDPPRRFRQSFGSLQGSQFFGYWEPRVKAFVQLTDPRAVASLYEKDGNVFVVVLNTTGEAVTSGLTFDSTVLNNHIAMKEDRTAVVFHPVDGQTATYTMDDLWDGPIKLELEPYQCRLVKLN